MGFYSNDIRELEAFYNLALKMKDKVVRDINLDISKEENQKLFEKLNNAIECIEGDIISLLLDHRVL